MHWMESKEIASKRARELARPIATFIFGLINFTVFLLLVRYISGEWQFFICLIAGSLIGFGQYITYYRHHNVSQEIKIDKSGVYIKGNGEYYMEPRDIRGYSIVVADPGCPMKRGLIIYPVTDGRYSLGIPDTITDDQIHSNIPDGISYVSIIDEQSFRVPNA